MAADLPKEFDVVVLGTGMPESIVAAAFSRIGQSVLHLDRNEFYSGDWASFSLKAIEKWVEDNQAEEDKPREDKLTRPGVDEGSLLEEGEVLVQLPLHNTSFSQVEAKFFAREDVSEEADLGEDVSQITAELAKVSHEEEAATDTTVEQNVVTREPEDSTDKEAATNEEADKEDQKQTDEAVDAVTEKPEEKKDATCDTVKGQETPSGDGKVEDTDETDTKATKVECVKSESDTEKPKIEETKTWTVNKLKSEWRKFNIDISPKVLFSGGDMVELLISSDIAKYCEFKTVTRILTVLNQQLDVVPCSRAGVFSSKTLSMLEKRMLMKFLQFCAEYENKQDELADFMDKPFIEFLASKKLSANVKHYIQHSIAMSTDSMTTQQGLSQMRKFLTSLGRYGNTAFLWSLYGSGELPQSFCRLCAVFGGLYCLRMSASSLILDSDNKCTGVITTEGQRIKCKWLIMESSFSPATFLSDVHHKTMSRAVIMTERPLLPTGQHELSQMCLPCPDDGNRPVFVLELPPSSMSSPTGVYIFHLTRQGKDGISPKDDLSYAVNLLFKHDNESEESKPTVLWSLYFCQRDMSQVQSSDKLPSNVVLTSGPGMEIDIDRPVQEAKAIFQRILPEEEFLPKAPNPEDIVYIDDEETKVADGNTQSEFTESNKQTDDNQSDSKTDDNQPDSKTDDNQSDTKKDDSQSDSRTGYNQSYSKTSSHAKENASEETRDQPGDIIDETSEDQSKIEPPVEQTSDQSVIKVEEKTEVEQRENVVKQSE